MEVQDILKRIQPLQGQVLPIKTVQETQTAEEFEDAYAAEVNLKLASKVVKALDAAFPRDPSVPVNHLRRFAKYNQLPESLRSTIQSNETASTIFVLVSPPIPDTDALQKVLAPFAPPAEDTSSEHVPVVSLHAIRIPIQPPLNAKQAEKWTAQYWPVIFNPAAPRATVAPPPQILNRTRESIQPEAGYYLALAERVADEAAQSGRGRRVGAVIVDPEIQASIRNGATADNDSTMATEWAEAVVAVAGDARYSRREAGALSQAELHLGPGPPPAAATYNADLEGGPELHALMRAVELIAQKRREEDHGPPPTKPYLSPLEAHFLSQSDIIVTIASAASASAPPINDPDTLDPSPVPEKLIKTNAATAAVPVSAPLPQPPHHDDAPPIPPRIRSRAQGGYLCTDLDVYLTHEPCLCCSMGLLLSRFRAVVFPRSRRMISGGLASEPVVGPTCDEADSAKAEAEAEAEAEADADADADADAEAERKSRVADTPRRNYYGLHWRKELNWRALGFEFVEEDRTGLETGMGTGTAENLDPAFHA
ncbi:putative tRNA-specific adenosine-34 deaminase subunit Tad3 [Aspergillus clavatus NRRL 1]|uniref:tRNA-specific adenosine-34 deaminase subunit Tad3, putative n=1 Tax=Aspergillus clavatus (strain ATCC 1007 / CBS 513.65 / DSM 816 / NCTC 3887 / NRRL 1 / QM 1276 / 107) TaxID=344612 RepID=A1CQV7_ASPCL|nr:tRNA-specific adenosine-34 deaminase subunit Tad3, putative [Aspergillus clavatus NRRL 1]EAW08028.1 tRNA-specific adenosine-34 deaminase subunit Tad3, putative [Aspergillus clavatus NRRL 1]